ncbi:glycosyltransferase family 39 protein [Stella sp.]|uniref:glycosyltransferase family 39 protein n=1 Tax=Stella sp. TaxID=2912054 RepID=UPI0035B4781B
MAALVAAAQLFIAWTAPLLDQHAFRQTQTALTVYWYVRDGIDLLRPPLPLFGTAHPSIPFEFPLYQAVAACILKLLGAGSVEAVAAACRGVSFAAHLLAAWPLHRLARRHFSPVAADAAVLLWVALPYAVFWSTSAMIESTAALLVLAHLDLVDRAGTAARAGRLVAAAAVAGALAATVKITTFVVYLPAAGLLYAIGRQLWRPSRWSWRDPAVFAFAALLPMAAAIAWTGWADFVKTQNLVGGVGLTSAELSRWNFGTLEQRLSPAVWKTVAVTVGATILGLPGAIAFVAGGVRTLDDPRRMAWLLPGALGPLLFLNLYFVHDYYAYAILPVLVVLAGSGIAWVAGLGRGPWLAAAAAPLLVAAVWVDADLRWRPVERARAGEPPVYLFRRLMPGAPQWPDATRALEIARTIRAGGFPPGPIVVTGNDWMADIALYSERPAFMIGKDPDHWVGGCNERNWQAIRAERPVLFVKVRPSRNECLEAVPIHACTVADRRDFWIGRCMAGS